MLVPDLSFVGPGRTNTGTIDKKYNIQIKIKIKTDTEENAAQGQYIHWRALSIEFILQSSEKHNIERKSWR